MQTHIQKYLGLIGLLLGLGLAQSPVYAAAPAPDFKLKDLDGKVIHLKNYRGKTVYLDFWASWCRPCVKSFPWMNDMHRKYKNKNLVILAVNLDQDQELINEFLQRTQPDFKILLDPSGEVADRYQVVAMPSSYIIDKQGRIVDTHLGFLEKDTAKKEQALIKALNQ